MNVSSFNFSSDPEISRSVDTRLYSRRAIADAQAAYRGYCQVETRPQEGTRLLVTVKPHKLTPGELRETVLEFWNYVLDATCQQRLG